MLDLPGLRMGRPLGRWVCRDDIVAYLRRYAAHHGLECRLGDAGTVTDVVPVAGDRWRVGVGREAQHFDGVVIATGHARQPKLPELEGIEEFGGRFLHSSEYRRAVDHTGRRVVVIAAGSSGGEICVDLARADVNVTWAVRTAPAVLPPEVAGLPTTRFGPPANALPDGVVNRIMPWLERRVAGPATICPNQARR